MIFILQKLGSWSIHTLYLHALWMKSTSQTGPSWEQPSGDGRTDGRTHHSRALYIINYIVNSDACVDAHLKTKLVYYLVYIYRLLRNCILSGCHFGTGIIIRHNVKSWLLCVIYWPFHMKIILPTGEINFLQEIFKNPKGFSRIIFRIKQKVFLQEFYSNKYFFL